MEPNDACPGEGRGPSRECSSAETVGDGLLGFGKLPRSFRRLRPSQENRTFVTSAATLSGMVCAVLGWTPEQFWNATPAELAVIFSVFSEIAPGHQNQAPLGTQQLEKLKETFPDG